jgi:hypothetical protein
MDWVSFFEKHGVRYVEGPAKDVSNGAIGIPCPICGDDTGTHYAVVAGEPLVKGCWRDQSHFMTATELVQLLAGCTPQRARRILFGEDTIATVEQLEQRMVEIGSAASVTASSHGAIVGDPAFKRFTERPCDGDAPYREYLEARGFDPAQLSAVYDVSWCSSGPFGGRVIVPIYEYESQSRRTLMGWTGRTVVNSPIRYRAHPSGDALSRCLLETGFVDKQSHLVIVEGPFDALRVAEAGYSAVALMTNRLGPGKFARLEYLADRARKVSIMLDSDAMETHAFEVMSGIRSSTDIELAFLPAGVKDPGEMTPDMIRSTL